MTPRPSLRPAWLPRAQRALSWALATALALLVLSWTLKGGLDGPGDMRPELMNDPIQGETRRQLFEFGHGGEAYRVRPVAEYELWGLVVTHNDPSGFGDVYHDDSSVDTLDVCVIWGPNLQTDDYQQVSFSSGSFTCYWQHGPGVRFDGAALANNHLIATDPSVRERIAQIRRGDQIHVVGALIDYQAASYPSFWRETSTVRDDDGPGACEVVLVDRIEILQRGTPLWYAAYGASWWLVALALAGKLGLVVYEMKERFV